MITKTEYEIIKTAYEMWEAGEAEYPGHNEVSSLEVYEFVNDPPEKYFLYINEHTKKATTWTGEILGSVEFGTTYISNFGDARVPVWVNTINGKKYHGTYYRSAGDYARIKQCK